ncbi:S1C family serine protease [Chloroflexota bacterium]
MKRARIKHLLISLFLVVSLLICATTSLSCTIAPEPEPQPAVSSTTPTTAPTNPDWTLPVHQEAAPPLPSIAAVVAEVRPSVSAINTEVTTYDFFNRPFTQEGAGSGWIIDDSGIIVTNNHVIQGANNISVTLADGRSFPASVIGADALTDVAVLKIEAENLVKADTGNSSDLLVGNWVVAIGNSLGMGISATTGIVSAQGVSLPASPGQTLYDLIQTDAAINPGNSGGPLVNMAGEVIGINSIKIAQVGVEGMGYAISIDSAAPVIESLIQNGYVIRPWLGVVFADVDQWLAVRYKLAVENGVFVTQVAAGSPADKAGLTAQDVIVGFDGQEITSTNDLVRAIHKSEIDHEVNITFWRGDRKMSTSVTLTETPPPG